MVRHFELIGVVEVIASAPKYSLDSWIFVDFSCFRFDAEQIDCFKNDRPVIELEQREERAETINTLTVN